MSFGSQGRKVKKSAKNEDEREIKRQLRELDSELAGIIVKQAREDFRPLGQATRVLVREVELGVVKRLTQCDDLIMAAAEREERQTAARSIAYAYVLGLRRGRLLKDPA